MSQQTVGCTAMLGQPTQACLGSLHRHAWAAYTRMLGQLTHACLASLHRHAWAAYTRMLGQLTHASSLQAAHLLRRQADQLLPGVREAADMHIEETGDYALMQLRQDVPHLLKVSCRCVSAAAPSEPIHSMVQSPCCRPGGRRQVYPAICPTLPSGSAQLAPEHLSAAPPASR